MLGTDQVIIRLLVAALCAGLVGLERERRTWAAGMRTHMLVGLGSCLFMMVSSFGFADIRKYENVELDPSRVAAQVVSGIGFLGAGTIFFLRKGVVRGLTTASGLWTVAGIGLAIGGGMYVAGVATTAIAIAILWLLKPLERVLFPAQKVAKLHAALKGPLSGELMAELMSIKGAEHLSMKVEKEEDGWDLMVQTHNTRQLKQVANVLNNHEQVKGVTMDGWSPGS